MLQTKVELKNCVCEKNNLNKNHKQMSFVCQTLEVLFVFDFVASWVTLVTSLIYTPAAAAHFKNSSHTILNLKSPTNNPAAVNTPEKRSLILLLWCSGFHVLLKHEKSP